MKILLLNPQINAQHKVHTALQAAGHVVLLGTNTDEAWKLLQSHGSNLDLALIHREPAGGKNEEYGTQFVAKIKSDPKHSDLPIILSSEIWNETQFFQHQQSKLGVNAYLHWPFDSNQLLQIMESMFSASKSKPIDTAETAKPASDSELTANTGLFIVLEESTSVSGLIRPQKEMLNAEEKEKTGFNIVLDPPAVDPTATATASVAPKAFKEKAAPAKKPASEGTSSQILSLTPQPPVASSVKPAEKTGQFKAPSSAGEIDLPEASRAIELALTSTQIPSPPSVSSPPAAETPLGSSPEDGISLNLEISPAAPAENSKAHLTLAPMEPIMGTMNGVPKLDPPKGTSSLTLGALMNEDLEPHERLEIMRKLKNKQTAESAKTSTMVLDQGEIGLNQQPPAQGTADLTADFELGAVPFPVATLPLTPPPQGSAEGSEVDPVLGSRLLPELSQELTGEPSAELSPDQSQEMTREEVPGELSYLFERKDLPRNEVPAFSFIEPVGDAVVPGGVSHAPDVETLKKYLMLREQDVAILSNQLKSAREQIALLDRSIKEEKSKNDHLSQQQVNQNQRIEEFEKEKALALQGLQSEIDELKFQNRTKNDKARSLEAQVKGATDEIDKLKSRVRTDIRKIRVREKELENKLEIVKKDSEALISTREARIMDLKRKIDLLEFNMDLLQDQLSKEKENSAQLRERLGRAAQVVRVAGGLLDSNNKSGQATSLSSANADLLDGEAQRSREAS